MLQLPPLSLYIHVPWCVQKCPYSDFNSHAQKGELPHLEYVAALLEDLDQDLQWAQGRPLSSIFIGGGTPSLLAVEGVEDAEARAGGSHGNKGEEAALAAIEMVNLLEQLP